MSNPRHGLKWLHEPLKIRTDYAPPEVAEAWNRYQETVTAWEAARDRWKEKQQAVDDARQADRKAQDEALRSGRDLPAPTLPMAEQEFAAYETTVTAHARQADDSAREFASACWQHREQWTRNAHQAAQEQWHVAQADLEKALASLDQLGTARDLQKWTSLKRMTQMQTRSEGVQQADRDVLLGLLERMKPAPVAEPPRPPRKAKPDTSGPGKAAERATAHMWG